MRALPTLFLLGVGACAAEEPCWVGVWKTTPAITKMGPFPACTECASASYLTLKSDGVYHKFDSLGCAWGSERTIEVVYELSKVYTVEGDTFWFTFGSSTAIPSAMSCSGDQLIIGSNPNVGGTWTRVPADAAEAVRALALHQCPSTYSHCYGSAFSTCSSAADCITPPSAKQETSCDGWCAVQCRW